MPVAPNEFPFHVEWLPATEQHYHGPKVRMRQVLADARIDDASVLPERSALTWLLNAYPECVQHIQKAKFYRVADPKTAGTLRFIILWCGDSVLARELLFETGPTITRATGWYPVVTGRRYFHHQNSTREFTERGLRKAMNKTNIEQQPGLGTLLDVIGLAKDGGTSILLRTTTSDIVLDAGLSQAELDTSPLRPAVRKWLFLSHAHGDHTGGFDLFLRDRNFVIATGALTLELLLASIGRRSDLDRSLPRDFFYRVAPMWYGSSYHFTDGSSVKPVPTYHFPGSMGFLFRFSGGKTLFYSGDLNVRGAYLAHRLGTAPDSPLQFDAGPQRVDIGIIEAAFVGRPIGVEADRADSIVSTVQRLIDAGRHVVLLAPPADYGLYLFLHLYSSVIAKATRTVDAKLFLDPLILEQLALLEWRMKRKQVGSLDSACLTWLASRSTLGESVRVFDSSRDLVTNVRELVRRRMKGVFLLSDRLASNSTYFPSAAREALEADGVDTVLVGKAATVPSNGNDGECDTAFGGAPWLLHSSEADLASYLLSGPQRFGRVYLFHNFKRRLQKFAKALIDRGFQGTIEAL